MMSKERSVNKATLNYWVDIVIAIAFVASGISGLVFLIPVDLMAATGVLGLSFLVWDRIHVWSSLAMMAGVGVHLLLHAKWIAAMTKRVCKLNKTPKQEPAQPGKPAIAGTAAGSVAANRRRFLIASGVTVGMGVLTAVCGSIAWAGAKLLDLGEDDSVTNDGAVGESAASDVVVTDDAITDDTTVGLADASTDETLNELPFDGKRRGRGSHEENDEWDEESAAQDTQVEAITPTVEPASPITSDPPVTPSPAPTPLPTATAESAQMCVTCPRQLVNDPYPGRCRLYVDTNGNGICDRSEPQPCG